MYGKRLLHCLLPLCCLYLLAVILTGCGKGSDGKEEAGRKTEIVFWHSYVQHTWPALEELVKRFEEEHPNITLKAQYVQTGDALLQKLAASTAAGTAPDVCWVHIDWLAPLSREDLIYNLEELAEKYGGLEEEERADFVRGMWDISHYRGELRMMPLEITSLALAYNKDLFRKVGLDPDKPPKDWEEFVEYGKKLTIRKGKDVEQWATTIPIYTGLQIQSYTVWLWSVFLWGEGGLYADPGGEKVAFNNEAGVRALQFWVDLQHKYRIGSMTTPEQGFESQKVAMALMGSWDLPHLNDMAFDWGLAPLPAGSKRRVAPLGGEFLVIFRQSKHPEEAWEFVRWFVTPEIQEWWSERSKYLPVRLSALESPSYKAFLETDPGLKVFAEQMPYAYAEPIQLEQASEIDLLLFEALEKAVRKVATPRKALNDAAREANEVLAKAREAERAQGGEQR
ncbi:MAG: extracellular solute-binding protein [Armatimonadetes bacterium]|nr:extracellular solute-binding protein [Armatimonadota bacterium]NIM22830.1 extracellular solute-binding protein [Armatimonadota bacterium]NIM66697.1 extracellular solute-binding protein [Armatimonadota bacterium]NIM75254.1 extracellular solute-binding protein [Armatimonadota bacterium]NIN04895.1 extracellular solute-binding protein [Armatimonadota bacterium]